MSASPSDRPRAGPDSEAGARVAALYDEHPYPNHGVVSSILSNLCTATIARHRGTSASPLRLLDAGCGTGEQTIGLGRAFPDVEVVGIDFNRRSIERAQALARRHCSPVRFAERNLLEPLDDLGPFEVICCVGTLHHLPEPAIGFRSLRSAGRPGSTLVGMVYGRFGRAVWFDARDAFRLICPPANSRQERLDHIAALRWGRNSGLWHYAEELRARRRFGPRLPLVEAFRRVASGRNTAYQADAFTHEVEWSFSWAELDELALVSGWSLEGWPERSGMPDQPAQVFAEPAASAMTTLPLAERAAVYERLVRPANLYFLARASS